MGKNKLIEFLKNVNLFSLLTDVELRIIARIVTPIKLDSCQIFFHEGDKGNALYIVKSGRVSIFIKLPNGYKHEITQFKEYDFFGEMSIFDKSPRSATCATKEKSVLLSILGKDFFKLVKSHPKVAIKIMYRMLNVTTQRLRNSNEFLSQMVQWGEEARKRAIIDQATGVYNRSFLEDALNDYFIKMKKSKKPLSIIMMDLDYFRRINEDYGHEMGDKVLTEAVNIFKIEMRKTDIIARYGGDEFMIVMPETEKLVAKEYAENIRKKVEQLNFLNDLKGEIKKLTTSQGIASFPENAIDLKTLREKADQALYKAKEGGRNKVYCAD